MAATRESVLLEKVSQDFMLSTPGMTRLIKDFHREMERGLAGRGGSLKMFPTYVDSPTGKERGDFMALDLGGTNFRVLTLSLAGNGRIARLKVTKFAIPRRLMTGRGQDLFRFLASSIKRSIKGSVSSRTMQYDLGFTFSFPVKQSGIASGTLVVWTKDFSARGVVGKDVVALLEGAIAEEDIENIHVTALANDTVGTLVARAYGDRNCDVGVIIGTGTNACYRERLERIGKWKGPATPAQRMIVNIEWGNFNKLKATAYDRMLDRRSDNPGQQILEKMVSGMYLGEIVRLVLVDLAGNGVIFSAAAWGAMAQQKIFKSEYITEIEGDRSRDMRATADLLKKVGVTGSSIEDRRAVKKACEIVSTRAARIAAGAIAAVVTKTDSRLAKRHTVAIDGSVFEKHPDFARKMRSALRELFGAKASRIKLVLSKDGSGTGAAIIAAVAAKKKV